MLQQLTRSNNDIEWRYEEYLRPIQENLCVSIERADGKTYPDLVSRITVANADHGNGAVNAFRTALREEGTR